VSTFIATNVAALNAHRNLNATSIKMGKVLEKLSSGYRINRAADDAAGLGISEKMRSQIRGSAQALRNAQDGISMIQTAEGAMDEIHSILQRARELCVQAANGTMDAAARRSIATELVALQQEINRIASSTQFNGLQLLNGTLTGTLAPIAAFDSVASGLSVGTAIGTDAEISAIDVASDAVPGTYTLSVAGTVVSLGGQSIDLTGVSVAAGDDLVLNFDSIGVSITITNNHLTDPLADTDIAAAIAGLASPTIVVAESSLVGTVLGTGGPTIASIDVSRAQAGTYTFSAGAPGTITLGSETIQVFDMAANSTQVLNFAETGVVITLVTGATGRTADEIRDDLLNIVQQISVTGSGSAVFQVGANVGNTMSVAFEDVRATTATGLNLSVWDLDAVEDLAAANARIAEIDAAITTLNTRRSNLGAAQNRLEHTIASLGIAVENLSAAESRIRDADIAQLSSQLVSAQILQQAGVAVLAQANQSPQAVLALLQR